VEIGAADANCLDANELLARAGDRRRLIDETEFSGPDEP
jgi:hypothetical protein